MNTNLISLPLPIKVSPQEYYASFPAAPGEDRVFPQKKLWAAAPSGPALPPTRQLRIQPRLPNVRGQYT